MSIYFISYMAGSADLPVYDIYICSDAASHNHKDSYSSNMGDRRDPAHFPADFIASTTIPSCARIQQNWRYLIVYQNTSNLEFC